MSDRVDTKSERKPHVQELRKIARSCGSRVTPRDDVKRDLVVDMVQGIRDSDGDAELKRKAERVFLSYNSSFAGQLPSNGPGLPHSFRMRGRSFLLTYNWDFFSKPFPDGTPKVNTRSELWRLWRNWKADKKKAWSVAKSTSTMEASERSHVQGRVHLHWKIDLPNPSDQNSTAGFEFCGVRPDARPIVVAVAPGAKKARGANFLEASNRAHFYTWAPKNGTIYTGTNWKPWEQYRVMGKWLDDLWTDGKLDNETYESLSLRVRVGHASRKRDVELVLAGEKESRVDVQIAEVDGELKKLRAPFRTFPEVEEWEDSFLLVQFRWKLLVLVADSASGKSSFAENLFSNPFVLTIEDAEHLDLKGFHREVHDGLVLDNVNSWRQLLSWRAVLQARNAKSRGGQSATNMYSYVQYLYGVAVVATVDLDAPDSFLVNSSHKDRSKWLLKNCVIVRLPAGEAFYDQAALPQVQVENRFSLFAQTVKRRRMLRAQVLPVQEAAGGAAGE